MFTTKKELTATCSGVSPKTAVLASLSMDVEWFTFPLARLSRGAAWRSRGLLLGKTSLELDEIVLKPGDALMNVIGLRVVRIEVPQEGADSSPNPSNEAGRRFVSATDIHASTRPIADLLSSSAHWRVRRTSTRRDPMPPLLIFPND